MLGHHRRKIRASDVPRDQFGRRPSGFSLSRGPFAAARDTVADSEGFTSRAVYISSSRRTQTAPQRAEDFMDAEDFDSAGIPQLQIADRDISARLLCGVGFSADDARSSSAMLRFSHDVCAPAPCECPTAWIDVAAGKSTGAKRAWTAAPADFDCERKAALRDLCAPSAAPAPAETFSISAMFHAEGEGELAKEIFGRGERRTVVPWQPARILRQRFAVRY